MSSELEIDEQKFWDRVYVAGSVARSSLSNKEEINFATNFAAKLADQSIIERRKRTGEPKSVYR